MRTSILAAFALAVFAGCAHKAREAPADTTQAGVAPAGHQATAAAALPPPPVDEGWPRTYASGETPTKIYQPQLESWDGFTLKASAAVEVDPVGGESVFGIAQLTARTTVDYGARTVKLDDVKVPSAQFPSAPQKQAAYLALVREAAAKQVDSIALERLEADLAIAQKQDATSAVPIRNEPPAIVFSLQPAVLVYVYGEPRYGPVKDTRLSRLINTRVLLLRDDKGTYYLHLYNGYVQAPALKGPWTVAAQPPAGAGTAEEDARKTGSLDLLEGPKDPKSGERPVLEKGEVPQIYVATRPT